MNVVSNDSSASNRRGLQLVEIVPVSRTSQVRILISEWRGSRKLVLHTYTAAVPDCWMPSGVPVLLPIEQLPELVAALAKAGAMA